MLTTLREEILKAVIQMAKFEKMEDGELVQELIANGHSEIKAHILSTFVPLAFARIVIRKLTVNPPVILSENVQIRDFIKDRVLDLHLGRIPEYNEAINIGEETFSGGIIPKSVFSSIALRSAELNAINNTLNLGKPIAGGKMRPPMFLNIAECSGFEEWYENVR